MSNFSDLVPGLTATTTKFTPVGGIAAITVQAAIAELDTEKANLASPTLTGTPVAPTAVVGANTTQVATTAHVFAERTNVATLTNKTVNALNGGQLAGMRNRIINGACTIIQRGPIVMTGNEGYGGPDRFCAANLGAVGQFTQASSTITFGGVSKPAIRQTVNTPTTAFSVDNSWSGIFQFIEGFNCFDLVGKPTAVSFIFNTNLSGTYSVSMRTAGGQSYVTTFSAVANTPSKVTVSIPTMPIAAGIPASNVRGLILNVGYLNQGNNQTATLNTWVANPSIATASTSTNWAATTGNFIELTELQLEEGTEATPFERRNIVLESDLCLRYFQRVDYYRYIAYQTMNNGWLISFPLLVIMRTIPTISGGTLTTTNITGASFFSPNSGAASLDVGGGVATSSAAFTVDLATTLFVSAEL